MPREDHFQDVSVSGNLSLGAQSRLEGNLIPDDDDQRDLGSATNRFGVLYARDVSVTEGIGFAAQTANTVFSGPSSGAAAEPTFRALVDADVPNTITLDNLTQITTRSHTSLSDIGTNTHAQIDTHVAATSAHGATGNVLGTGDVATVATTGSYNDLLNIPSTFTPAAHALVGATHTVSELTTGQALRATSASAVAFGPIDLANASAVTGVLPDANVANNITLDNLTQVTTRNHSDLQTIGANDHHNQSHVLATTAGLGGDHTTSGLTAGQVLRASGATTAAFASIQDADIPATITRDSEVPASGTTQSANVIFSGPASGVAAAPTFRALVDDDIPNTITLDNITQITTRSHTSLSDIGANTHAQIDTHIAATAAHGATGAVVGTTNTQTLQNKTIDNSNTATLRDDRFTLQDDVDTSKQLTLQLSGLTTATTRTWTVPDASGEVTLLGQTIGTAEIEDNAVSDAKLRDSAGFSVIGKNTTGTGNPADIVAGDETVLGRTAAGNLAFAQVATGQIANNAVTDAKLRQSAGFSVIGTSTTGSGEVADITAGADQVLRRSGSGNLLFGTLATAHINTSAITNDRLRASGALSVIGRSASGAGTPADISGTSNQVLRVDSGGTSLGFGAVNLASSAAVTGVLPAANLDATVVRTLHTDNENTAHTGTTAETVIKTYTLPANTLGAKGGVQLTVAGSITNVNSGAKTIRVRWGGIAGTVLRTISRTAANAQGWTAHILLFNKNATNSQQAPFISGTTTDSSNLIGSQGVTAALDTTANQDIVITGQLADAGDTITAEHFVVVYMPGV